ncbi:MAG: hemerythrin domain-containing protein [Pseudonocardiaceae bacterium]
MDGLDVLTADHNRLRGLFTRFQAAHENNDITAMGELAEQIFTELEVHTAIEEQIFYPAVHDLSEELDEVVDEGVQEHHVVDVLIEEARALRPSDAEWVAKLTVLIESVEHHAEEEETELFPQVRSAAEAATRKEWGTRFEKMKADRSVPTPAEAAQLITEELRRRATKQQIPGRSTMTRDDLIATIDPR